MVQLAHRSAQGDEPTQEELSRWDGSRRKGEVADEGQQRALR